MSAKARAGLATALLALAAAAAAQEAPSPAAGFVLARCASRTALGFYAGYAAGPVLAVVGMIQNPYTQYREVIVGAGAHLLASGRLDGIGVGAAANTTDGWFTQLYLVPSWRAGRVSVTAPLAYYVPLDRSGVRELDVTPATAIAAVSSEVGVGATWAPLAPAGGPTHQAPGPARSRSPSRAARRDSTCCA